MQKRNLHLLKLAFIALFVAIAPELVQAQQVGKIGFISMEEIMATSESGKTANEELKKLYEKNRNSIQGKEQELRKLKDELEKQRPILTEQALKEKELSYQKKFRDYQDVVKDANDDINARRQEMFNKFIPDILKIVSAIGEKEKYTMILDMSTVPIAYYQKENNLTKRIVDEFNAAAKKK